MARNGQVMDHDEPKGRPLQDFFANRDYDAAAPTKKATKCVVYEIDDEEESKDASCQIGKEPELIDEDLDDLKYSKMAKHIGDFEVKPYDHREDNKA